MQQRQSRINTKDYWLNVSRTDLSYDNYDENNNRNNSKILNSFCDGHDNSGMMLFSPIPLTSLTAIKRPDNPDWLGVFMNGQVQPQTHIQTSLSFLSDNSIMKSPKLEKHQKMFF